MPDPSSWNDALPEYAAACSDAVVFELSARGKIELAGPDARLFLHNLCTNDVKDLPVGAGCEAFLCTAKARVIAHLLLGHFRVGDQDVLWIDFDPGIADKVQQHLNHYLISERVELTDRTRDLALLRVAGPGAKKLLDDLVGDSAPEPAMLHHRAQAQEGKGTRYIRRVPCLSVPAFDVVCSAAEAATLWQALIGLGAVPAGHEAHEILRVEAGWPAYGVDMDENRFVVEVGRPQAISYTKGCFLGQEPIVMARDRGHVNRLLLGIKVENGDLRAGMRLFRDGNEVGQITSAVRSPRLGQCIGLAYLKRGHWEAGTVLTIEPESDGRPAVVASLPLIASA